MHCHDWRHSSRPCGSYGSYGSYGTPEFIILDFSPITNITSVTQIANALSAGGGVAAASNVVLISQ
jgi:hypothetical protein